MGGCSCGLSSCGCGCGRCGGTRRGAREPRERPCAHSGSWRLWFESVKISVNWHNYSAPGGSRRRFVGSLHVTCGSSEDRVVRDRISELINFPILCRFFPRYRIMQPMSASISDRLHCGRGRKCDHAISGLALGVHAPLDRDDPPALQPPIQPAERRLHSSALELAHALQAFEGAASSACQADTHRDSE